ncbi:hypothetical protein K435DRAFT_857280 [Dendrothele bispora CBS 962.96]|uniref:Peptidase C14 caspase domain-containing protein n=1 Tax=Dendrothele bispora (strain CBS 962.96) TaxID=1314807 RepID=A0A4S8M6C7_DENBC|nr:hypothetical protein K435DRAFT_857280 [Dendrothele bispora CBS 962.96]
MNDHVKRRALLIGISYQDSKTESSTSNENLPKLSKRTATDTLEGTHNDVRDVRDLLIDFLGYSEEDIILMTDDPSTKSTLIPTRSNIINQLEKFIQPDEPNTRYFFLYAGHSRQIPCKDGTEEDGLNECIVPSDAFDVYNLPDDKLEEKGNAAEKFIMDDILYEYLVQPLEQLDSSRLTAVLDTCHSGTLLDLPHYRCNRYIQRFTAIKRRVHRRFNEFGRFLGSPSICQIVRYVSDITFPYAKEAKHKFCKGYNCLRVSSRGRPSVGHGLLTSAFIEALKKESHPKLKHLMRCISSEVDKDVKKANKVKVRSWRLEDRERNYAQNPQLSSDIPADMSLPLDM